MGKRILRNILVTGGSGFIGSNFIHYMLGMSASGNAAFTDAAFDGTIINVDCLTYAGNPENLSDVDARFGSGCANSAERGYFFEKADICDRAAVEKILGKYDVDTIVHFAAESHVDRSILGPEAFVRTNVNGTYTLLDCARQFWSSGGGFRDGVLFHHVSTDEVYGSLGKTGFFTETTPYDPRSPYSASKAASDHLVMAYFHTYGLPVTLSNCTNNYGPYQFPEKLIPLMILNMSEGKSLPVYGDGKNIRDWIYVEDHNRAVWQIMRDGRTGGKYNIGGENEWENIRLLDKLIELTSARLGKPADELRATITHVADRPGHDRRYAIDCAKIKGELGWERKMTFEEGLAATVEWNLSNPDWIGRVRSGEYRSWVQANYGRR